MGFNLVLKMIPTLVCILITNTAFAQLDPFLIAPSVPTSTEGLESSRYIIKNRPNATPTPAPIPAPPSTPEPLSNIQPPKIKAVSSTPKPVNLNPDPVAVNLKEAENNELYDLIKWDTSKNILELKTAAFFVYNESKSNFLYRNYNSFSQGLGVEADIWAKPEWGIELDYKTTINSHTQGMSSATQLKNSDRWTSIAFQFRGMPEEFIQNAHFVTKVGYFNYQKVMPPKNTERMTLDYSGLGLVFESFLPVSKQSVWNFSLEINPFNKHKEKRVGTNLSAGRDPKTWGWGIEIGNKIIFSKQNQFFWNFNYQLYKSIFDGDTAVPNPGESSSLVNVPVTNSVLFFNLGFVWGR